jgi:hypothetical protein
MYKRLLPSLFLIGCSAFAFAQAPTLTQANSSPVIGETYLLKVCNAAGVLPGPSGAAQTWNFTGLSATSTEVGKVVSCLSTPNCSSYPGSTFATTAPAPAHITNYLSSTSTKLIHYGFWLSADTNLILSDPMEQLRYPVDYGNTFSDPYAGIMKFSAITAHETGTVTVTADAWGTLQLPGRTDTALRVRSVQLFTDSTYVWGSPVLKTFSIETYAWYKPNYHAALLTISTVTDVSTTTEVSKFVAYAPKNITGYNDFPSNEVTFELFPNPASKELNIQLHTMQQEDITVTITDMLGREKTVIKGQYTGSQDIGCDISSFQKGIYLVRIQSRNETITKKIEIQ